MAQTIFLAKLSPDGYVIWLRHPDLLTSAISTPIGTNAHCLAYDGGGGILLTGSHDDVPVVFGNDTLNTGPPGNVVSFVVKYDTAGNVIWAKDIGSNNIYSNAITADELGNAYVTGFFTTAATYIGENHFLNVDYVDSAYAEGEIFVVKYNSDGAMLWAKAYGSWGDDQGKTISTDGSGHVFIGGSFGNGASGIGKIIQFDGITFTSVNTADDMFVVGLNSYTGQAISGFQLPCGGAAPNLVADNNGSLYATSDQYIISPLILGPDSLYISSTYNSFIAKFNSELPLSVHSIASERGDHVSVYPNPTSGKLTIAIDDNGVAGARVVIYDLTGQVVLSAGIASRVSSVDLSTLAKGVYLYKIFTNSMSTEAGRIILD